jgi:lipopolysaccharide export system permease protein
MKKLLFRKFIQDNFKLFSVVILSIGSIVWIIQSVNFLDFVTEDGHGFKTYLFFSLLNFPKILHRILPFIFFVTLFYQIIRYEENNQLLVFWIHGVRKIQLVNVIIVYSVLLALTQIVLGGFISPKSQDAARSFIRNSNLDFFASIISPGKFVDTVENLTIFIEEKNKNGLYENIYLKDDLNDNQEGIKSQIIFAKRAKLINEEDKRYFKLLDGQLIKLKDREIETIKFESINFDLSKFVTKTTTFPKLQEVSAKILIKCIVNEYNEELHKFKDYKYISCNKNNVVEIKQEILKRFYLPIYIPVIALITCLLILRSKEDKKYEYLKFLLFSIIFFVIIISEVSLRYSSNNMMGILFFTLFPILVFFSAYYILIKNINHKT